MEKISDKNRPKFKKKLPDLNETMRVYCPNEEKKVISRLIFYDPRISRIHKIMSKICPKFVQNFSTYMRVYTYGSHEVWCLCYLNNLSKIKCSKYLF
jgi:hypothetical protein